MAADSLDEALIALRTAAMQNGNGAVRALDEAVARVMRHRDQNCIGPLLSLLDDGAPYDEGMFSLIHAAEAFDDETYVRELLAVLPELRNKAPKWAEIVLMRGLNNGKSKDALARALPGASSGARGSAAWLCEKINERDPAFLDKTSPILAATK